MTKIKMAGDNKWVSLFIGARRLVKTTLVCDVLICCHGDSPRFDPLDPAGVVRLSRDISHFRLIAHAQDGRSRDLAILSFTCRIHVNLPGGKNTRN